MKSESLADTGSAGTWILNFAASRTERNRFPLIISHLVYGVLLQQLERTKAQALPPRICNTRGNRKGLHNPIRAPPCLNAALQIESTSFPGRRGPVSCSGNLASALACSLQSPEPLWPRASGMSDFSQPPHLQFSAPIVCQKALSEPPLTHPSPEPLVQYQGPLRRSPDPARNQEYICVIPQRTGRPPLDRKSRLLRGAPLCRAQCLPPAR